MSGDYTVLVYVPSGSIGLLFDEGKLYLQFNCSCEDALPYCNAMCCQGRPAANVTLSAQEASRLEHTMASYKGISLPVLAVNESKCYYLSMTNRCKVHSEKPKACSSWHCSPEGRGEGIMIRDKGWVLNPAFEAK